MNSRFIGPYLVVLLISLQIIPIMISERQYIDDYSRVLVGYLSMNTAARPLGDVLLEIINLGAPLTDLAPLPLLIASVFLSIASIRLSSISGGVSPVAAALAGSMIFLNPFFIENLSYRFDSVTMSLSMLFVIAASVYSRGSFVINSSVKIALLVASLSLYQMSIMIFPIISVALVARRSMSGEVVNKNLLHLAFDAIIFVISCVLYKTLIVSRYLTSHYAIDRAENIPFSYDGFYVLFSNILSGVYYVYNSFSGATWFLLIATAILAQIFMVWLAINSFRESNTPLRYLLSLLLIVALPVSFFISFLHLAILIKPGYAPRLLMAFGAVLFLMVWLSACFIEKVSRCILPRTAQAGVVSSIAAFVLAFTFLVHSYAFGNAQTGQREWEQRIAYSLADDIYTVDPDAKLGLVVIGRMSLAASAEAQIKKFPILAQLVPVVLHDRWAHGYYMLAMYGLSRSLPSAAEWQEAQTEAATKPAAITRPYYKLTKTKTHLVVNF